MNSGDSSAPVGATDPASVVGPADTSGHALSFDPDFDDQHGTTVVPGRANDDGRRARRRPVTSDADWLVARLRELGWTLGVAESLTGGLVAASIVDVAGASTVFQGGIVAYATPLKASLLGVDPELLAAQGPVHPEVARQMAEGVRAAVAIGGVRAHVGLSTTGIAGPDSPDGQPVGTVHVGISTPLGSRVVSLQLPGNRSQVRQEATRRALRALLEAL